MKYVHVRLTNWSGSIMNPIIHENEMKQLRIYSRTVYVYE